MHAQCVHSAHMVQSVQSVRSSPSLVTTRRDGVRRVLTERAISPPAARAQCTMQRCQDGGVCARVMSAPKRVAQARAALGSRGHSQASYK